MNVLKHSSVKLIHFEIILKLFEKIATTKVHKKLFVKIKYSITKSMYFIIKVSIHVWIILRQKISLVIVQVSSCLIIGKRIISINILHHNCFHREMKTHTRVAHLSRKTFIFFKMLQIYKAYEDFYSRLYIIEHEGAAVLESLFLLMKIVKRYENYFILKYHFVITVSECKDNIIMHEMKDRIYV